MDVFHSLLHTYELAKVAYFFFSFFSLYLVNLYFNESVTREALGDI
jgi:hypothetical protein